MEQTKQHRFNRKLRDNIETIKNLCGEGKPLLEIASTVKVSRQTLSAFLKSIGLTAERQLSSQILENGDRIKELHSEGWNAGAIAKKCGINSMTVKHYLIREGLQPNKVKNGTTHERAQKHQKIVVYYLENHSLEETGAKFGMTRERVRQILNKEGIKPRNYTPVVEIFRPKKVLITRERFWSYADKSGGEDACWLWTGSTNPVSGYGRFTFYSKHSYAHRIAYLLANKKSPKLWILHSCDNPPCVNPKHLREGTPAENVADRELRGRSAHLQDYDGWMQKLSASRCAFNESDLVDIADRLKSGESQRSIANAYNVTASAISNFANGKTKSYQKFFENKV